MNVVVLRHTPAVAAHLENNETVYSGLEVEVSAEVHEIRKGSRVSELFSRL